MGHFIRISGAQIGRVASVTQLPHPPFQDGLVYWLEYGGARRAEAPTSLLAGPGWTISTSSFLRP